jgi:hypothetical protein
MTRAYLAHAINDHPSLISAVAKMATFGDLVAAPYRPIPAFLARTEAAGRVLYYACVDGVLDLLCSFPGLGAGFDLVFRDEIEDMRLLRSNIPSSPRRVDSGYTARSVILHVFDQFGSRIPVAHAMQELMATMMTMRNHQLSIPTSGRAATLVPPQHAAASSSSDDETGVVVQTNDEVDDDLVLENNGGYDSDEENEQPLSPATCSRTRRCHRFNCGPCNGRLASLCVVMFDGARGEPPFRWDVFVPKIPSSLATPATL